MNKARFGIFTYKKWNFTGKVRNGNFAPYMMQPHTNLMKIHAVVWHTKYRER